MRVELKKLKGILYVGLGASSYGVLATFVKVANGEGAHTSVLTFSQFTIGVIILTIMAFFNKRKSAGQPRQAVDNPVGTRLKLLLFGTSFGLTSTFYYLSIQYVPVSVGIILLMQTIWMSIVLEAILSPKSVGTTKIVGGIVVIGGTLLATNIFASDASLDIRGILLGLLAALSYTCSMYASNHIGLQMPSVERSRDLIVGGLLAIILFWNFDIPAYFEGWIFFKWGFFLSFFGTILPPLLFTRGIPLTGTALGGIISAVEIPISILFAYWILQEPVSGIQWLGVLIILCSVVLVNLRLKGQHLHQ